MSGYRRVLKDDEESVHRQVHWHDSWIGVLQSSRGYPRKHTLKKKALVPSKSYDFKLEAVIPAHFQCTREVRNFLIAQAGASFRYTVRLQEFLKANSGITFAGLINEWRRQLEDKKLGLMSEIGPQFEYNQFTRDYFADPRNRNKSKSDCIKAWNEIKMLPGERKYKGNAV